MPGISDFQRTNSEFTKSEQKYPVKITLAYRALCIWYGLHVLYGADPLSPSLLCERSKTTHFVPFMMDYPVTQLTIAGPTATMQFWSMKFHLRRPVEHLPIIILNINKYICLIYWVCDVLCMAGY
jgi:hypothetical protein